MSKIADRRAFLDAVTVVLALGGSTNAVIHLIAMAGRCGVELSLDDFDRLSRRTPVLADVRPTGEHLMEDFYYAGGLLALMAQIEDLLHLERTTANGKSLAENISKTAFSDERVIRRRENPLSQEGGLAILHGNLAPNGAVIKHAAASANLLTHTGPAVVFEDYSDMQRRVNDARAGRHRRFGIWCCATQGPKAARVCPSTACSRSRTSCCARGYGTWFASPTPG